MSDRPQLRLARFQRQDQGERDQSPDIMLIDNSGELHDVNEPKVSPSAQKAYQHLLQSPGPGLEFLYSLNFFEALEGTSRLLATEYGIWPEDATEEFRRFLAIKFFTSDEKATKVSPTQLMDEMWHAAILDTAFYTDLQRELGLMIGHRPAGAYAEEAEQRCQRLAAMEAIYRTFFLSNPIKHVAFAPLDSQQQSIVIQQGPANPRANPKIRITVMGALSDMKIQLRIQAKFKGVYTAVANHYPRPLAGGRLLYFNGTRIQYNDTCESLGLEDGDFIDYRVEIVGC